MKILLVHNKYQQAGGEDAVFESESALLIENMQEVDRLIFDNKEISTSIDKMLSGIKVFYNSSSGRQLQEKILSFVPDIIHVHNFVPLASPAIFYVAHKNKIPVIVTLHNYRLICPSATLFFNQRIYEKSVHSIFPFDAVLKGVYRSSKIQTAILAAMTTLHNLLGTWRNKIDKFIVLTEFARTRFQDSALRVSKEQFVLKPNFIEDPGNGEVNRKDFFLYVGRLSVEKGIDTLLSAFKLCNYKLKIIGDGPLRSKVELAVKSNTNIEYAGFQKKNFILNELKSCKALLCPSVCYEGFPLSILEAFATGTPVIGSRIGGIREIISDNNNGLHFETGNANDLVDKMSQINNQALATSLAKNARGTYLARYTPQLNYKMLMDIYSKAILEKK